MRRMDDITGRCLERSTRESIQIEAVNAGIYRDDEGKGFE